MCFCKKRRVPSINPVIHFFIFLCSTVLLSAQDTATLKAVVIQSTRTSDNSPVPHNNFKAALLERISHAQDMPYLLTSVPSLVETSDAGAGIGYTGLRIRGTDPTRINVTINGVPVNDAESQGMFWVDLPDLAASAAEVQVQRGVGASTNGAGAFGATINVDLSKMSDEPIVQISGSAGSFDTRKQSIWLNTGPIHHRFSFGARVSNIQSDGFIDRATADLQSVHLTGTYMDDHQSVQMHLLHGHERTYQAWYGLPAQYFDAQTQLTYNPAGTEKAGLPHPNEVDNYDQRHHLVHYKRTLSPKLFLQLNGHYTRGKGYFEQYKANQFFSDYLMDNWVSGDVEVTQTDLIRRRWLDNHFYGSTWALVHTGRQLSFTWGGALSRYQGKHFGEVIWAAVSTAPQGHRYYENDAVKNDLNSFVKAEMRFSNRFTTMIDLQIRGVGYSFLGYNNQLESVKQNATLLFFNPKCGFNYALTPMHSIYLFAGVGHREPNRDDFTQSTPESRPKPERLLNLETGIKSNHEKWSAQANFFGMYYRNQLVLDGRINDVGAYIRTNVPQSYRAGVEIEGSTRLLAPVTINGNISISTNKINSFTEYRDNWADGAQIPVEHRNTDLAFSPNLIARGEVCWNVLPAGSRQQLALTWSTKFVGRQFLDNTSDNQSALAPYTFTDFRVNWDIIQVLGRKIALIASVNNLLGAQYATNGWLYRFQSAGYDPRPDDPYARLDTGDNYHLAGYFPQAGRNYMITALVSF